MASRSPEDWISFLLAVIECTPAKPIWNDVAEQTGAYKSGKFASAAFLNLSKKYPVMRKDGKGAAADAMSAPSTPQSKKKRAAAKADLDDDDDEQDIKPKAKRGRKAKVTTKKVAPVVKDDSSDEGEIKEEATVDLDEEED